MENVYQTKVKEKLQKLEENKQNVRLLEQISVHSNRCILAFKKWRNPSREYWPERRETSIERLRIRTKSTLLRREFQQNSFFWSNQFDIVIISILFFVQFQSDFSLENQRRQDFFQIEFPYQINSSLAFFSMLFNKFFFL